MQIEALRRVIRDEAFISLYAGLGSDVVSTLLTNFVFFYSNVFLRKEIARRRHLQPK